MVLRREGAIHTLGARPTGPESKASASGGLSYPTSLLGDLGQLGVDTRREELHQDLCEGKRVDSLVPREAQGELDDAALTLEFEEGQPATRKRLQHLKDLLKETHEYGV
jgi:hypothetical protein